ncbi:unnamed protein product [Rotaria sordida]|uniref:Uncharacterized protein n=1 Tax=Rotaria sordida TaxID=392033 RepID=A0A814TE35_9BILA|nr:unnamed protein product [Rotaria sordida]CAF1408097.1 unnamed protein product [Rotaria sordida]
MVIHDTVISSTNSTKIFYVLREETIYTYDRDDNNNNDDVSSTDTPEIMNINQSSSSSLSRSLNDPVHEQNIVKEESHLERSVPESYHHSSYEYLSSTIGEGNINQLSPSTNLSSHQQTPSPPQKYPNKYVTSSSYSPTSYRYPPASTIDDSTHITYPNNRSTQQQQQLLTSSHSTHVPQHHHHHNNTNRHSLHPTTSDDPRNESHPNYQQQLTNNTHFVVVAIDFGTTFSGYAFAFTRDIDSILMMRKVDGNDPGVINQKTPTTILLTPNLEFHSFGFFARDFFHDLDPEEAKRWLYFEKFKMHLHYIQDLNTQTLIAASNGRKVPALTIFTYALQYFKEHALRELSDQSGTRFVNEDVRWVITVPAIWKQSAKQFMREAAYQAGIASREFPEQLLIALEPEAASIYIRKLRMHQFVPDETPTFSRNAVRREHGLFSSSFSDQSSPILLDPEKIPTDQTEFHSSNQTFELVLDRGTRYIVVDCGGGTVDITVHELDNKMGTLKELYKATGGPYGSVGVDQEFENLMNAIFGIEIMEEFKLKRPAGYVDLMIAFEARKRTASPFKNNPLNISLPFSFIDFYKKKKGSTVEAAIRRYNDPDIKWSTQGMMRLTPEAMKRLFHPTIEKIKATIGEVLNTPDVKGIQYLFLVGGFAESPILQHEIRRSFSSILKVIIPQDVSLTILKGAVLFGLDPTIVNVRRSRLTYGVSVLNRFIPDYHPIEKRIVKDNIEWCADIFDKFVLVDQSIGLGDIVIRKYTPARHNQAQCIISFYCSESDKPIYVTDPGVRKIGTLVLDMFYNGYALTDHQSMLTTAKNQRREIQTRMVFGDTEIKVSALDVTTGKCVRATIDFLNK